MPHSNAKAKTPPFERPVRTLTCDFGTNFNQSNSKTNPIPFKVPRVQIHIKKGYNSSILTFKTNPNIIDLRFIIKQNPNIR